MKVSLGETHYDVLQVAATATVYEIRQAYADANALYGEDALVTYTLFEPGQRKIILDRLTEAFDTLVDPDLRREYDAQLIREGKLPTEVPVNGAPRKKVPSPIIDPTTAAGTDSVKKRIRATAGTAGFRRQAQAIIEKDRISGSDLRQIREALGITCEEIYNATRISVSIISAIESDDTANLPSPLFLKNFLKTYAALLAMDPQRVMDGYLKNIGMD